MSNRRTIPTCVTARKLRQKYCFLFGTGIILIGVLITTALFQRKNVKYEKPEFDPTAKQIEENEIQDESYSILEAAPDYQIGLCGMPQEKEGHLIVYFTNPKKNQVWMQLLVFDDADRILAQTGIIKPGERIENVMLSRNVTKEETIKLEVLGYEPDTYYSAGKVSLQTKIK